MGASGGRRVSNQYILLFNIIIIVTLSSLFHENTRYSKNGEIDKTRRPNLISI